MGTTADKTETTGWTEDVLNRKPYADFLTRYLVSRANSGGDGTLKPFTLAIDAEWGHGKTFFVERWAKDLQNGELQRITLVFDAWKADYTSDPVVSFMAEFKACIDDYIQSSGVQISLQERATEAVQKAFKGMRRAIMPAGKVVLTSLLKKASGVAVDEVIEACVGDSSAGFNRSADDLGKASIAAMNKGLDAFFDRALEEQAERRQAIGDFKTSVALALETLSEDRKINLPMFVFIDELDRCRPDFAIALLEGVKHLFDIPGVCFVVTTNIRQLSASVKAVYGQDFDGHRYLKRLFDAEFDLPPIEQRNYAKLLVREYPELNDRTVFGLPPTGFSSQPGKRFDASDIVAWVAEAFSLDLRSLRKVAETTVAASSGVPQEKKIYLLWMTVLVAIRHKSPEFFDALSSYNASPMNSSTFRECWNKTADSDSQREFIAHDYSMGERRQNRHVALGEVAQLYYEHSFTDMKEDRGSCNGYPQSVQEEVARNEMPTSYLSSQVFQPSTAKYFDLVRTAGHLIAD
jgi:hypothetical protein